MATTVEYLKNYKNKTILISSCDYSVIFGRKDIKIFCPDVMVWFSKIILIFSITTHTVNKKDGKIYKAKAPINTPN